MTILLLLLLKSTSLNICLQNWTKVWSKGREPRQSSCAACSIQRITGMLVLPVIWLGHTQGFKWHPLMVRRSWSLLDVAGPVEVELGEGDSFDSVLHGKERRGSCCSVLLESDKAKSCCSQEWSEKCYSLSNFWGMARKSIVPLGGFSLILFCLQLFWRLVLKEEASWLISPTCCLYVWPRQWWSPICCLWSLQFPSLSGRLSAGSLSHFLPSAVEHEWTE